VRDQVSHPYKRTGKTTVLYTLIFVFCLYQITQHNTRARHNVNQERHANFLISKTAQNGSGDLPASYSVATLFFPRG
jgi:hypothetical protein